MPKTLIIIACTLLATACAKTREPDSPASSLVQTFHAASATEAEDLAKHNTIHCASPNACPAGVGQFTGQQGNDVSACTAFLVGDDLAVTNAHCIPSSVKLAPSLCADRVRITFPATGEFREESIACKTLEARSDRPNDISPDLALIRLARGTGRPSFPVQTGVNPGATFTVFKMNPSRPSPTQLLGELVAESCPAVANNYLFPLYRRAMDSVFVAGCASVPGNSGSPVVSAGGVVGLLQASLRLTEAQRKAWLPYLEKPETDFAPLALGTSLRCLDMANGQISPNCPALQPEEIERPRLEEFLRGEEAELLASQLIRPYLDQNQEFAWAREVYEHRPLEQTETLRPQCILAGAGNDPGEVTVVVPRFRTYLSMNRFLQPTLRMQLLGTPEVTFRFSRFDLLRTGETRVSNGEKTWTIGSCE